MRMFISYVCWTDKLALFTDICMNSMTLVSVSEQRSRHRGCQLNQISFSAAASFSISVSVIPFSDAKESHLTTIMSAGTNRYHSDTILNGLSIELQFYAPHVIKKVILELFFAASHWMTCAVLSVSDTNKFYTNTFSQNRFTVCHKSQIGACLWLIFIYVISTHLEDLQHQIVEFIWMQRTFCTLFSDNCIVVRCIEIASICTFQREM